MQDNDVLDDGVEFLRHTSCDNCGSSDANAEYTDGHHFCFSCHTFTPPPKSGRQDDEVSTGSVADEAKPSGKIYSRARLKRSKLDD